MEKQATINYLKDRIDAEIKVLEELRAQLDYLENVEGDVSSIYNMHSITDYSK